MKQRSTQPPKLPDNNKKREQLQAIAKYSGLGMEIAIAVIGSAFLGQWLDKKYGHETPVITLVLSFLGVIYVFYRIFKVSSK